MRKMQRDQERKKWGFVGRWCPRCRKDECQIFEQVYGKDDTKWPSKGPDHCTSVECAALDVEVKLLTQDERRAQLQDRVEDMKKERLAKALARDRWNRWKSTQNFNRVGAEWEQQYNSWDKWMPSDDEEDELPPAPPPDTPEFKMMEKDMDDRAKDKAERRAKAEVLRQKGNVFLEEGKYRNAFTQYTKGLEEDKSSRALLTNRALCCLKLQNKKVTIEKLGEDVELGSYQQCIDDCTKCLDICEFLYDNTGPGIKQSRLKAHMRRAEAKKRLGMLADAVTDVEEALANIADLSVQEKKQLNELIVQFRADKDAGDRVKRLRQIAGVADISVLEAHAPEAVCPSAGDIVGEVGGGGAGADSEAETERAPSSPESSSESPVSQVKREEETAPTEKVAAKIEASTPGNSVGVGQACLARKPAKAALYDKNASSSLGTGQRVAIWADAIREEEVEGMVAFDNEDGTYDIVLDDGSERDCVPRGEIRCLQQQPKEVTEQSKEVAADAKQAPELQAKSNAASRAAGGVTAVAAAVPAAAAPIKTQVVKKVEEEATAKQASAKAAATDQAVNVCKDAPADTKKGAMRKVMVVEDDSSEDEEEDKSAVRRPAAVKCVAKSAAASSSPAAPAANVEAASAPGPGTVSGQGKSSMADIAGMMPGMLPGLAGSPEEMQSASLFAERMAKMMQDPEIAKSLLNPKVQKAMAEMMSSGASATSAPSDEDMLERYKDDPEVLHFYKKVSAALDGVFKQPYPCDDAPSTTSRPAAASPAKAAAPITTGGPQKKGTKQAEQGKAAAAAPAAAGTGGGFGGLASLDGESLSRLRDNPDLQAALRDPKMLQKLHTLMQNPAGVEARIAADPELAALEDKLMAALGTHAPATPAQAAAPAGPGSGEAVACKRSKLRAAAKVLSAEGKLKASLALVQRLKSAVQAHATALAAVKGTEDIEDQDKRRRAAHTVLCSAVEDDLMQLQEYIDDDADVVALVLDQGGVESVCSIITSLPPSPSSKSSELAVLTEALTVLQLVATTEGCMQAVMSHDKGRTMVKLLAWMQGLDHCGAGTVADVAQLMEIALQHDALRRTLLKKSWSYSAKGAASPQRISLLAAAAAASARPEAMQHAIGCITNAAFEEQGKEQLLIHEQSLAPSGQDPSAPSGSILEAAARIVESNPCGASFGGSSPGVLRAKAMRLLLNVSASAGIRTLVGKAAGKAAGLRFLVRVFEEQVAACSKAKYSASAADSVENGQDALDTSLGLLMNLGLDDGRAGELLSQGVLTPLASLLQQCPWESCQARAASAAARLVRFPLGARQGREGGVLQGLIQLLKKAAGTVSTSGVAPFPPPAGAAATASDAQAQILDPCVRALAQALRNDAASVVVVGEDITALLAVVAAVKCGREGTVGNAALVLQTVANREEAIPECLKRLAQAGSIPALLNVVHHMRGPAQKNAALALARIVKREENLAVLKALHGIDILNCYLKL
jgi:tetratricopeptide (TPR) repeat protein